VIKRFDSTEAVRGINLDIAGAAERMTHVHSAVIPGQPRQRRDPGPMYPCLAFFSHAGVLGSRLSRFALGRDDSRE
jgi:hypothetical protein